MLGKEAQPNMAGYTQLKYLMRCINESMRLYPHPPVLLRRAEIADTLPGGPSVHPFGSRGDVLACETVSPATCWEGCSLHRHMDFQNTSD